MIREKIKRDLEKIIKASLGIKAENIFIEVPENPKYGDYASNFAIDNFGKIKLLKTEVKTSLGLAQLIVENFPKKDYLEKIETACPGFINFYLSQKFIQKQVGEILKHKRDFGINKNLKSKNSKTRIQVEFISANPTGPLHAGNCRGGFAGDVLANILKKLGFNVQREYYINDKGVQVERLTKSVKARYRELLGEKIDFPEDGYWGVYVKEIAQRMIEKKERNFKEFALSEILKMIKETVTGMKIKYDNWFSEESLYKSSQVKKSLTLLEKKGLVYKKDNALWFKSSGFGDDKDRVLIKSDGEMTYLVSDIAYHIDKFEKRKFDRVILFWGADHIGYIKRFQAMIAAIGHNRKTEIEICQLLKLSKRGKEIRMSKRKGVYITIDDIISEIGLDAGRFHFLMYSLDTPMILDLERAKEQSVKNPVYYVQYAYARISSILRKMGNERGKINLGLLNDPSEIILIKKLIRFPELLLDISSNHQINRLPLYALELADSFHRFYERCRVLTEDKNLTRARLALVKATKIILRETFSLMGISAPEKM